MKGENRIDFIWIELNWIEFNLIQFIGDQEILIILHGQIHNRSWSAFCGDWTLSLLAPSSTFYLCFPPLLWIALNWIELNWIESNCIELLFSCSFCSFLSSRLFPSFYLNRRQINSIKNNTTTCIPLHVAPYSLQWEGACCVYCDPPD
jgi:hypothetical protein